jgi:hypothetical protein
MAKRKGRNESAERPTADAAQTATADATEQWVMAFAEQLGRMVGTVQARAEGWMERDALTTQVAGVRDAAVDLLERLAGGATPLSKRASKKQPAAPARRASQGRSGGVVDAPGKKHRKPLPSDPAAKTARSQAATLRAATPMVKTSRRRGRG